MKEKLAKLNELAKEIDREMETLQINFYYPYKNGKLDFEADKKIVIQLRDDVLEKLIQKNNFEYTEARSGYQIGRYVEFGGVQLYAIKN